MKKIIAICLLLAGTVRADYQEQVSSWMGHSTEELVQTIGYPTRQMLSPAGNMVYIYERSSSAYVAGYQMPSQTYSTTIGPFQQSNTVNGTTLPGYSIPLSCTTSFEIQNSIIVGWSFRGNSCS